MLHLIAFGEGRIGLLISATPKLVSKAPFLSFTGNEIWFHLSHNLCFWGEGACGQSWVLKMAYMEKYVEKYCSEVINFKKTKQQENCILMNHSTSSILIMETQCLLESAFIIENFDGTLYYPLCKKDKKKKKFLILLLLQMLPALMGRWERKQDHSRKMLNGQCGSWALCLLHQ